MSPLYIYANTSSKEMQTLESTVPSEQALQPNMHSSPSPRARCCATPIHCNSNIIEWEEIQKRYYFFWFVFIWGPHPAVLKAYSSLCDNGSFLVRLSKLDRILKIEPSQPHSRQIPYLLYYHPKREPTLLRER